MIHWCPHLCVVPRKSPFPSECRQRLREIVYNNVEGCVDRRGCRHLSLFSRDASAPMPRTAARLLRAGVFGGEESPVVLRCRSCGAGLTGSQTCPPLPAEGAMLPSQRICLVFGSRENRFCSPGPHFFLWMMDLVKFCETPMGPA